MEFSPPVLCSGCGRRQESPTASNANTEEEEKTTAPSRAFLKCSRCKIATYCSKPCQIEHWKASGGGHKFECFTPEQNERSANVAFSNPGQKLPYPPDLGRVCIQLRGNEPGCCIYLGPSKNKSHKKIMILTDCINKSYVPIEERLILPKVPPRLLEAAVNPSWNDQPQNLAFIKADQEALVATSRTDARLISVCLKFQRYQETIVQSEQVFTSEIFYKTKYKIIFKSIFSGFFSPEEPTRARTLEYVEDLLKHYQWSNRIPIPDDIHRRQPTGVVGKALELGGGITMFYSKDPAICFADLTKSEKAWYSLYSQEVTVKVPIIRIPVVIYCCTDEDWWVMRASKRLIMVSGINSTRALTRVFDADTVGLKIFLAGAEIGDIALLLSEHFEMAMRGALSNKQELLFLSAAEKLIALLHPRHKLEEACCIMRIGAVYEALASRLLREESKDTETEGVTSPSSPSHEALLSAALAYKRAADLSRQIYPFVNLRKRAFESLAMALERLGDLEMASRAFVWACTDPVTFAGDLFSHWDDGVNPLRRNMIKFWEMKNNMSDKGLAKANKKALKEQRDQTKKAGLRAKGVSNVCCGHCGTMYFETAYEISRCSRCKVNYCSAACQQADWKEHRLRCSKLAASSSSSTDFEKYADCPDETRDMLSDLFGAGGLVVHQEFSMSLAAWSHFVDQQPHTPSQQGEPPSPPRFLQELLDVLKAKMSPSMWID